MVNKKSKKGKNDVSLAPTRVRYPKKDEFIGIVEKRLGGSRMTIRKMDGSTCMAIVPGRMKRYLWIREEDIVLLKPWAIEKEKADLIYKFKPKEVSKLTKDGYLKNLENTQEF